jgi:hypothetical protein
VKAGNTALNLSDASIDTLGELLHGFDVDNLERSVEELVLKLASGLLGSDYFLSPLPLPECSGVYFLASVAPRDRTIKIGFGASIKKRVHALRTAHPWPLALVAFLEGADRSVERALHAQYATLRLPGAAGREWFRPDTDLITEIVHVRREGRRA